MIIPWVRARAPDWRIDALDRGGLLRYRSPSKRGSAFPLNQLANAYVPLVIPFGIVVTGIREMTRFVGGAAVNDQPIAVRAFVLTPTLQPRQHDQRRQRQHRHYDHRHAAHHPVRACSHRSRGIGNFGTVRSPVYDCSGTSGLRVGHTRRGTIGAR